MSLKVKFIGPYLVVVLILAVTIMIDTAKSEPTKNNHHHDHHHNSSDENGFGFIHTLKGCHRGQNISGVHKLKRYLEKFGYLNSDHDKHHNNNSSGHPKDDDVFDEALESALRLYQRKYHLKVTGTLDDATVEQMSTPRCGNPDNDDHHSQSQSRKLTMIHGVSRYSFFPGAPRWPASRSQLSYQFTGGAAPATPEARGACARAFRRWEQVSHFRFREVPEGSTADITIGFHRGDHGDGAPFDGPGRTFAHAFSPTNGRFHFDAEERWSVNPTRDGGLDLESVAVHEIGHVLGLYHEPGIPDSIMFPSFGYGRVKRDLHSDDIRGIRALYGLTN